jgi:hypothetical protein
VWRVRVWIVGVGLRRERGGEGRDGNKGGGK